MRSSFKNWLFGPDYDRRYQRQVEDTIAREAYLPRMLQYISNGLAQAMMLFVFALRPGGLFLHPRRIGYVSCYLTLLVCTPVFALLLRRLRDKGAVVQNRLQTLYAVILCAWSCGICALDQLGGGGVTVFCYMLPAVAALSVLDVKRSTIIFVLAEASLLVLLLLLPWAEADLFSAFVNSLFTMLISILIAGWQYAARSQAAYKSLMLQKSAVTDQLTGLFNRRYMDTELLPLLAADQNEGTVKAVIMMDIDHFKEYNDRAGHLAGDHCLEHIAQQIKILTADSSVCAIRYGGEEFFLCFPDDGQKAPLLAEALRKSIADMPMGDSAAGEITVSAGVYVHPAGPANLETLIRRADVALYRAKDQGRNSVVADIR